MKIFSQVRNDDWMTSNGDCETKKLSDKFVDSYWP